MKTGITRLFSTAAVLALSAGVAKSDFVINDDLIVDGSACIGFDCVNGESFGFDTIRLKENNLRIKFDDTSTAASFPRNDWQLTANASANGGASKFSIDDISGGRTPFTVEANAPSNSLYVDDGGRIGSGTSTPSTEIHTVDGDTPTLRLQQDGSSGFAPQTWDVAGNETNFFIRDVTNGSTLPLRIRPGAPTSSIFIDTDGDVAMGSASPDGKLHVVGKALVEESDTGVAADATLHVRSNDGTVQVRIEDTDETVAARTLISMRNNGITTFNMIDTSMGGGTWGFQNRGSTNSNEFRITNSVGAGEEFILSQTGDLTITGELTTTGTTCGGGCDLVFSDGYDLPSITEHAKQMYTLGYLPNVGPTVEGEPFSLTDKLGRMLNELEHAHIYIADQEERIGTLEARNADLVAQQADLVAALTARIDALETE